MKRSYAPDPKPQPRKAAARRVIRHDATATACLRWRECACCGAPSATGHHVLSRAQGGDDVIENIVPLCGSGTTGCHGMIENEDEQARRLLGAWVLEHRPDTVAYLEQKLGKREADDWLRRRLYAPRTVKAK